MTDIDDLLQMATTVCQKAGYPTHDDQYQSEIALGVAVALNTADQRRTVKLSTWCCRIAVNQCACYAKQASEQRKGDEAGAKRGICMTPVRPPIPLPDFNLLNFVACHGKTRAAKLLGMRYYRLVEMLDDVALRLTR